MSALVIVEVRTRAEEVINGFKRVTDQQARDVVRLVAEINAKDAIITNLEKKVMGLELMLASQKSTNQGAPLNFEGIFSDIFGKPKF